VEVETLWTARGLEPRAHGGCYEHVYLDIYPPSMQTQERPHIPSSQLLRPGSFATAGDDDSPEWLIASSSIPLVYVTFGTLFGNDELLSTIVRAVSELPVRVAVTVGPNGDPASLGPQPENVHVARYVPQDQILPLCAVVVSHGGSGTFLASLASGLPQLCVPLAADQFLHAAACASSHAGLS